MSSACGCLEIIQGRLNFLRHDGKDVRINHQATDVLRRNIGMLHILSTLTGRSEIMFSMLHVKEH